MVVSLVTSIGVIQNWHDSFIFQTRDY